MEGDSPNGKLEEDVKLEDAEDRKYNYDELDGEVLLDLNSEQMTDGDEDDDSSSSSSDEDAEPYHNYPEATILPEDIETPATIVESVESSVILTEKSGSPSPDEKLQDNDVVIKPESTGTEEKNLLALDGESGTISYSAVSNGNEGKKALSDDCENVSIGIIRETTVIYSDEKNNVAPEARFESKTVEETKSIDLYGSKQESSFDNGDVVASEYNFNELLQVSTNFPPLGDNIEVEHENEGCIHENKGNPSITSLSQRTQQPTSWRSCCGLLDVLRRYGG